MSKLGLNEGYIKPNRLCRQDNCHLWSGIDDEKIAMHDDEGIIVYQLEIGRNAIARRKVKICSASDNDDKEVVNERDFLRQRVGLHSCCWNGSN